ncbi:thioesterase II family protein [Gandjariella thermophila]|uniref:Thioesterase n=1 Tax=Gandjariella thermophila TaxID=1931992 RepID=A0A4D4J6P2_9PSEU|nr:thioesterase domain-containing protein [Gandjariella thermophila]GDY29603.1 thioesterase [Gandjariella thermophila]
MTAGTRWYLMPYAGGGPRCYERLTRGADGELDATVLGWDPARYAADGGLERLARDLGDEIAADLAERPVDRYGLFGHSMGALVAFEVAGALRERRVRQPSALGVSGRVPPQCGARPAADPDQPDSVARYLRSCGGELAQAADDPEFVDIVCERLRHDIGLGTGHRYVPRPPMSYPVVAFGGASDPLAAPQELAGWLDHGSPDSWLHLCAGGHWFLWDHAAFVLDMLRMAVERRRDAAPA